MEERTFSTRIIAEISVVVALSTVLSYIKVFELPQGGSITAASMVPILWLSVRRGARVGVFTGVVYGVVQFFQDPAIFHPVQVLVDFPIAFGALGLAGLVRSRPLIGSALGIAGRFLSHFVSGIVFFAAYAPYDPILYSAVYNGSYLGVELVVSLVVMYILLQRNLAEIYP